MAAQGIRLRGADANQCTHRYLQGAVLGRIGREAGGEARADLGDLVLGTREDRVVEGARDVERRLPKLLEAGAALGQLERLHPYLVEAGVFEQLPHPPA